MIRSQMGPLENLLAMIPAANIKNLAVGGMPHQAIIQPMTVRNGHPKSSMDAVGCALPKTAFRDAGE